MKNSGPACGAALSEEELNMHVFAMNKDIDSKDFLLAANNFGLYTDLMLTRSLDSQSLRRSGSTSPVGDWFKRIFQGK